MKSNFIIGVVAVIAIVLFVGAILFMARQFSLAVTTVDVVEVEPGVRCARMVTADGAAISCWQVAP